MKSLFNIILLLVFHSTFSQERIGSFDGISYVPDSIKLNGINQINKSEIIYFGNIKDSSISDDIRFKSYFYNDAGLIDSIIESSIDTNGRSICLSRFDFDRYGYKDWLKMEYTNPYCIWSSVNSWEKCDNHYSVYKIPDDSIPNVYPNPSELNRLNHTYLFTIYQGGSIFKDSIIKIDSVGKKSFVTRIYERNSDHLLVRYYSYDPENKSSGIYDEYIYEYDKNGNKTHKYSVNENGKRLVHYWKYDANQNIIYEEVEKSNFGISNRTYAYDKFERLKKIKEIHFGGGRFHYKFNYLPDGFTVFEKCKSVNGMVTIQTIKYQF